MKLVLSHNILIILELQNRGDVTVFIVYSIKGIICRFRLHKNPKIKDAHFRILYVACPVLFRTRQVYVESPLMFCSYLKSSNTNLSDLFDVLKPIRTFF